MIKIIENRRLWNVNHKVEAISDTVIKITVDDKEEIFDLSSFEDGEEYILEDSLVLPYNPPLLIECRVLLPQKVTGLEGSDFLLMELK